MLPEEYEIAANSLLKDTFAHVIENLKLSKIKMQKQYNKNIRFNDYESGQQVWLKVKHYKTGENRKLAPRRSGPWTVVRKLPNGVNFEIENTKKELIVVHYDCLLPLLPVIGFNGKSPRL